MCVSTCEDWSKVASNISELLLLLFQILSGQRHHPLKVVHPPLTTNDWVVYVESRWCWNKLCSWGELAWYVPSHPLIQPVRILDQTGGLWWWQGQWASHSNTPPPTPLPPVAARPFACLPHCRVIRTVTLYERGDDKRIYTQSLAEECISFALRVWTWVHEHKS